MAYEYNLIILAAGQGSRMRTEQPKSLVKLKGTRIIDYVLRNCIDLTSRVSSEVKVGLVLGHRRDEIKKHLKAYYPDNDFQIAIQKEQKGTAHAVECFFNQIPQAKESKVTLILVGDAPLIQVDEIYELGKTLVDSEVLKGVAATFKTNNPAALGRIIRKGKGFLIREARDASEDELKINEVNSGIYFVKTSYLLKKLKEIDSNNASKEFYLTDIFCDNEEVLALPFEDQYSFLGINNINELIKAEKIMQERINQKHLDSGVIIKDPATAYIDDKVEIGEGTVINPNVTIEAGSKIGKGCAIETGSLIRKSIIEDNVTIKANSYIEEAHVSHGATIGPMAHLRPGSKIGETCRVGNFVEIKKSKLDKGAKVSHLSYVGDSEIGEGSNIGCGFITCNYDGKNKHQTIIGKNSFIGSDCQTIAPVKIGDNTYIASGSTINKDVPNNAFAIARSRQETKDGMAKKFRKD